MIDGQEFVTPANVDGDSGTRTTFSYIQLWLKFIELYVQNS